MQQPSWPSAGSTAVSPQEWNLQAIQRILWQRRWLVLAVAAEVFLIAFLVTFLRTPLYEASARVIIERALPKVLDSEDVVPVVWNEFEIQRFYRTQYLLVKDPAVIERALDMGGLREALLRDLAPDEGYEAAGKAPPDDRDLVEYIRRGLATTELEYSNVIKVSFRHPDPKVAAAVVNASVHAYQDFFVETGTQARAGASDFLDSQIQEAQAGLLELERKLAEERRKLGPVLAEGGQEMGATRLSSLDQSLTQAKTRRAQAQAQLNAYRNSPPMGLSLVRDNPQVVRHRQDLSDMRRQMAELEARVGPDWPKLKELKRAIVETEANLEHQAGLIYSEAIAAAQAELELETQNEAKLERLFREELEVATDLRGRAQDYDRLYREFEQKRQALDRLLGRREEVSISADLETILKRQISIVAEAVPPESPAVPRVMLSLALGAAFGLFLGVAAAFLAEALDNKVRDGQQAAEIGGLPLLGAVPRIDGPPKPRLVFSRKHVGSTPVLVARQNDAREAFRALRSSLLLSHVDRPPRAMLVTSALPGEGKTTVCANLGRTLATFGSKVVVIDADLRRTRLHRAFKVPKDRGLANVLAHSAPLEDVVFRTQYPDLWVIPGGPCPPDPATLLHPDRVQQIATALVEKMGFDYVLFDSPPVLVFADAYNIVPAVEGVVLVARAMQTPKEALRSACEQMRKMNAPLIGLVTNDETEEAGSASYYRYYHYRRGYYRKAAEVRAATYQGLETGPTSVPDIDPDQGRDEKNTRAS